MRGGIRMESEAHLELSLASEFVFWSFNDPSCVFLEYDPSRGGVDCFMLCFLHAWPKDMFNHCLPLVLV